MIAALPVAGEKNPGRTPTYNMPIPSKLVEWTEDTSGKQMLTVSKLSFHEYGGFRVYQDPSHMHWHVLGNLDKEFLGVCTTRDIAHNAIDEYNRKQNRINMIDRIAVEAKETRAS